MCTIEPSPDVERWSQRLRRWSKYLHTARLDSLIGALLDAAEPLGPLGAQILWVTQPTLGLLVPREEIASLARVLEAPGGVAWLREHLIETDDYDQ